EHSSAVGGAHAPLAPQENQGMPLSTQKRREAKAGRAKHSRRFAAVEKQVDQNLPLAPDEALTKIKELATAKFDETIELAVNLGVDPRHGEQMVRGTINL